MTDDDDGDDDDDDHDDDDDNNDDADDDDDDKNFGTTSYPCTTMRESPPSWVTTWTQAAYHYHNTP